MKKVHGFKSMHFQDKLFECLKLLPLVNMYIHLGVRYGNIIFVKTFFDSLYNIKIYFPVITGIGPDPDSIVATHPN